MAYNHHGAQHRNGGWCFHLPESISNWATSYISVGKVYNVVATLDFGIITKHRKSAGKSSRNKMKQESWKKKHCKHFAQQLEICIYSCLLIHKLLAAEETNERISSFEVSSISWRRGCLGSLFWNTMRHCRDSMVNVHSGTSTATDTSKCTLRYKKHLTKVAGKMMPGVNPLHSCFLVESNFGGPCWDESVLFIFLK